MVAVSPFTRVAPVAAMTMKPTGRENDNGLSRSSGMIHLEILECRRCRGGQ
jgi:hypothetical protein